MAKQGFSVIDSDMHVVEPPDLWQRYLPSAYRSRGPVGTTHYPRDIGVVMDGVSPNRDGIDGAAWGKALLAHMAGSDGDYEFAASRGWDAASQLEAMDLEGIDVAVLYPSRGLFVLGLDVATSGGDGLDPSFAAAIARAYNDWLAGTIEPSGQR